LLEKTRDVVRDLFAIHFKYGDAIRAMAEILPIQPTVSCKEGYSSPGAQQCQEVIVFDAFLEAIDSILVHRETTRF
jgi:hypothetical protein